MSLQEYAKVLPKHCEMHHKKCHHCDKLVSAANMILSNGLIQLAQVFKTVFPTITYHSHNAKRLLMKMPIVSLRLLHPTSGVSKVFLMQYIAGVDYCQLLQNVQTLYTQGGEESIAKAAMSKDELKSILQLACSDRERECIRYAVFKSSGLSTTGARRHYGLENMDLRSEKVNSVIKQRKEIYDAINDIASVQEKAILQSCGMVSDSDSDSFSSDSDCQLDSVADHLVKEAEMKVLSINDAIKVLEKCNFNWFAFSHYLNETNSKFMQDYTDIFMCLTSEQKLLIEQSHSAYSTIENQVCPFVERELAAEDGDIVSESDEEHPDSYLGLQVESDKAKSLIEKKVVANKRKAQRTCAKLIAERNFLNRKKSKKLRGILKDHPDIGERIEEFVKSRSIGADAWRRTGVLTFDGNRQVKEKVTYGRIKSYLEEFYKRKFAYGTIVQLCCARNKRRLSARRYKGVAQVTSRRSRKGFEIKYNPDHHWSAAFYRGLSQLQFTNGKDIVNLNRDDASGF